MPQKLSISADTYTLELPCELTAVREACRQARACLAEAGLAGEELDVWELILAEAGNNAVEYAVAAGQNEPIAIEVSVTPEAAEARIFDHTPGFDFPEKTKLPPPDSESGRGLFLIQNLTDSVRYFRGRGENCLVLKRQRRPADKQIQAAVAADLAGVKMKLAESQFTLDLMTEELASCYESLSAIFRFSAELADQPKPEEFARKWLNELKTTVQADWFALRLVTDDGRTLKLVASSEKTSAPETLSLENAGEQDVSVEARAASFRMDVWFDAEHPLAVGDPLVSLTPSGTGFAHPVVINDRIVGVLSVGRHNVRSVFEAGHVSIIQTFADFLGIQIRNAQFQEQQLQVRLTARELEIAAGIQRSLLPKQLPRLQNFQLIGHYQSARQVGGDFYDAFVTADGGLLLAIADVMGKGVPAAMFAAIFRSQLRAGAERAATPGKILTWMNQTLFPDLDSVEMFITAQLVYLDFENRTLRFAAAGHPPLLLAGADGNVQALENSGMPLGVLPTSEYHGKTVALPPGANLLMFTDGLTEARDQTGQLLGLEPLVTCFGQAVQKTRSPEEIKAALVALVAAHQKGGAASDDETFLLLAEINRRQPS